MYFSLVRRERRVAVLQVSLPLGLGMCLWASLSAMVWRLSPSRNHRAICRMTVAFSSSISTPPSCPLRNPYRLGPMEMVPFS